LQRTVLLLLILSCSSTISHQTDALEIAEIEFSLPDPNWKICHQGDATHFRFIWYCLDTTVVRFDKKHIPQIAVVVEAVTSGSTVENWVQYKQEIQPFKYRERFESGDSYDLLQFQQAIGFICDTVIRNEPFELYRIFALSQDSLVDFKYFLPVKLKDDLKDQYFESIRSIKEI